MARILHCTQKPEDWQAYLADKDKHWRTGYSAKSLAYCWESANGFPPEVAAVFRNASDAAVQNIEPILAVPEFKVPLPGGDRPSQNDIFVLGRSSTGAVVIMVEGKVDESFGPTLSKWQTDASPGKEDRLQFLLRVLGLSVEPDGAIRYQLLHRAASALIEAERFHAVAAVMLVHSFSGKRTGWTDFKAFASLFGGTVSVGALTRLAQPEDIPLYVVWVQGDLRFTKV